MPPLALIRLPVIVLAMELTVSPPAKIRFLIARQSLLGSCALSNAAKPLTWGVAIEVPSREAYPPPGTVLSMPCPGAPTCTVCLPKFEKEALPSLLVVAATQMTLGRNVSQG